MVGQGNRIPAGAESLTGRCRELRGEYRENVGRPISTVVGRRIHAAVGDDRDGPLRMDGSGICGQISHQLVGHGGSQAGYEIVTRAGAEASVAARWDVVKVAFRQIVECL